MTGIWGTRVANETTKEADVILAVGTGFAEADCSSWVPEYTFSIPPSKLIQIDSLGATNDHRFRAFDAKSGAELWVTELPASGHSTPVTYVGKDGKQYVVIAASGGTAIGGGRPISDALVAFRLPN